jgi:hypothetical protein
MYVLGKAVLIMLNIDPAFTVQQTDDGNIVLLKMCQWEQDRSGSQAQIRQQGTQEQEAKTLVPQSWACCMRGPEKAQPKTRKNCLLKSSHPTQTLQR